MRTPPTLSLTNTELALADTGFATEGAAMYAETPRLGKGFQFSYGGCHYEVKKCLGGGGEAEVFLAETQLGDPIVLKRNRRPLSPVRVDSLLRAIALRDTLSIAEKRLARVRPLDLENGLTVQGYAGDANLYEYLTPLSAAARVTVAFDRIVPTVVSTVGEMHAAPRPVLHRDIKLANFVVGPQLNDICLVDTAHLTEPGPQPFFLASAEVSSPGYLSQRAHQQGFYRSADELHSLGVCIFGAIFPPGLYAQFVPSVRSGGPAMFFSKLDASFFSYGPSHSDFADHWALKVANLVPRGEREEIALKAERLLTAGRHLILDPEGLGRQFVGAPETFLSFGSGWTIAPNTLDAFTAPATHDTFFPGAYSNATVSPDDFGSLTYKEDPTKLIGSNNLTTIEF